MLTSFVSALVLLQAPAQQAPAAPAVQGTPFTQMITRPDGTLEMQTAAQRFVADGKPDVWLVGAIHVGTKPYYASLQSLLDAQGTVFYEGVRPDAKPAVVKKPATTAKPAKKTTVTAKPIQKTVPPKQVYEVLSDAIGLVFQQTQIKYNRPNWSNVDVTWSELERLNKEATKGAPAKGVQFGQIRGILNPNSPETKMFSSAMAMASPGMKEAIKIMMIRAAGGGTGPSLDPTATEVVLHARNKVVIQALDKALAAPTQPSSIGVLYGAKHLADIGSVLTSKYGYRLGETRWFPSADADPKKVDAMGKMLLDNFEKMGRPAPDTKKT